MARLPNPNDPRMRGTTAGTGSKPGNRTWYSGGPGAANPKGGQMLPPQGVDVRPPGIGGVGFGRPIAPPQPPPPAFQPELSNPLQPPPGYGIDLALDNVAQQLGGRGVLDGLAQRAQAGSVGGMALPSQGQGKPVQGPGLPFDGDVGTPMDKPVMPMSAPVTRPVVRPPQQRVPPNPVSTAPVPTQPVMVGGEDVMPSMPPGMGGVDPVAPDMPPSMPTAPTMATTTASAPRPPRYERQANHARRLAALAQRQAALVGGQGGGMGLGVKPVLDPTITNTQVPYEALQQLPPEQLASLLAALQRR